LCVVLGLIVFGLKGTAANQLGASVEPELPRLGLAALTLRSDRSYDFSGQVLRCRPGESIGLLAESHGSLAITNVTVEGCAVGIVMMGSSARLERVTVRNASGVCMLLAGADSIALSNVATGCTYGMAVLSNGNQIVHNSFNDNMVDGLLVTGDENLIEGNEALRNGGVGIHIARMVPMVGDDQFVSLIQDRSTANVIKNNRALENRVDLEEFGDCDPGLFNEWADNTFKMGRPECVR
jgi:Right handed beta helix region